MSKAVAAIDGLLLKEGKDGEEGEQQLNQLNTYAMFKYSIAQN